MIPGKGNKPDRKDLPGLDPAGIVFFDEDEVLGQERASHRNNHPPSRF